MDAAPNANLPAEIRLRGPRTDHGHRTVSHALTTRAPTLCWSEDCPDEALRERIAELTALNRQLQEALARQRRISSEMQAIADIAAARRSACSPACPEDVAARLASLTARQRQIMDLVISGHRSKTIAADLGINQRTVENHRAAIMRKMGAASLAGLIRAGLAAA